METVNLTLSDVLGPASLGVRSTATLNIRDQDVGGAMQFTAAVYSAKEGAGSVTIRVARSGGTAAGATVQFATSDGTATDGADYTGTSGTLTFGAGETIKTFTVGGIGDDAAAEGVETVTRSGHDPGSA